LAKAETTGQSANLPDRPIEHRAAAENGK
jgi:hypothetical protein